MNLSKERVEAILAGCEGVTPGPWDTRTNLIRAIDGEEAIPIAEMCAPWKKHRRLATAIRQEFNNSLHIANCDPDTIRSLASEVLALREAVKPFGALPEIPTRFDDNATVQAGIDYTMDADEVASLQRLSGNALTSDRASLIVSVDGLTAGDFRRARALQSTPEQKL